MARLFLVDGTALAYRSHFALQRSGLTTPQGDPCGATYAFAQTLRRLVDQEQPDKIAVAFDPPGDTFRHKRYAEYKATRQKAPEEMVAQLPWMRELVKAFGIRLYEVEGYEADDVIGTLAVAGEKAGCEVLIVTGDKDFMQLVSPRVKLYNLFKPGVDLVIEDEASVKAKFGGRPEQVIEVLAIMGDSSDNVPGVRGIGEKGATKLIEEYGSVQGVLEHLSQVSPKLREKIEHSRKDLELSRELVTIHTDVPLPTGLAQIGPAAPDRKALAALYQRLGFISLLRKLDSAEVAHSGRDYHLVSCEADLEAMLRQLRKAGVFALDTETTSLFPLQAELVGLSFSCRAGEAWYVPANADPPLVEGGTPALLERLRPLLTDPKLTRIGQNHKYDWLVLAAHGLRLGDIDFDTMVASFCVAGATRRHNLDDLALAYFDLKKIPTSDLIGRGAKQISMAEVPIAKVAEYACEDADVTFRLHAVLDAELDKCGARKLFEHLELPLVGVLAHMEERGIRLDLGLLAELGSELERDIAARTRAVHEIAGEEFNLNSPKALGQILFEKLAIHKAAGVKRPRQTQTGWATDQETLSEHYSDVPIVRELLEYREVQKLKSTYVDALPKFVNPRTARVHCSFSQVTAATGRLASSDPNLQNIPIRTERGRALRGAFVARERDRQGEWVLLTADYSQVELRILAHLAGDAKMRAAFAAGRDIHTETAAVVFQVAPGLVTREMRSRAKAVNFGLLYGMGAARLARETELSLSDAKAFIERYFQSFPKVKAWREALLERARETGYVETLFGRRRSLPELVGTDARAAALAENAAVNTPVQGSAADIIKRAMIDLERALERRKLAGQLLLQVHDELVLEVPVAQLEETRALVVECMSSAVELSVPLEVTTGHGRSWLEAH
jgi:DNA polymerase-1